MTDNILTSPDGRRYRVTLTPIEPEPAPERELGALPEFEEGELIECVTNAGTVITFRWDPDDETQQAARRFGILFHLVDDSPAERARDMIRVTLKALRILDALRAKGHGEGRYVPYANSCIWVEYARHVTLWNFDTPTGANLFRTAMGADLHILLTGTPAASTSTGDCNV